MRIMPDFHKLGHIFSAFIGSPSYIVKPFYLTVYLKTSVLLCQAVAKILQGQPLKMKLRARGNHHALLIYNACKNPAAANTL